MHGPLGASRHPSTLRKLATCLPRFALLGGLLAELRMSHVLRKTRDSYHPPHDSWTLKKHSQRTPAPSNHMSKESPWFRPSTHHGHLQPFRWLNGNYLGFHVVRPAGGATIIHSLVIAADAVCHWYCHWFIATSHSNTRRYRRVLTLRDTSVFLKISGDVWEMKIQNYKFFGVFPRKKKST